MTGTQWLQLVTGIAVLILVLPGVWHVFRQKSAMRNALIWLALLAALMWGYRVVVEQPQLAAADPAIGATTAPEPEQNPPAESESPVRNL